MAPRKNNTSNNLGPPEATTPSPSSPASFLSTPHSASPSRSASPSGGFTQIFTKPTKWFQRSNSGGGPGRSSISSVEPRTSTSSTRKHKISHPTDPRPIMDTLVPPHRGGLGTHAASRSVADLSLARTSTATPDSRPHAMRTPSSPSQPTASYGLGDLRSLSRKAWSKSADDLGKLSPTSTSPKLAPIDTTLHQKIKTYRSDSVSSSVAPSPSPLPSPSTASFNMNFPFPSISADLSTSPPKNTRLGPPPSTHASPITPPLTPQSSTSSHVHSRSHSFTPRLPSKLAAQAQKSLVPPSPKRKGSASSDSRDPSSDKGSGGSGPTGRSPFPLGFGFGGSGGTAKTPPSTVTIPDGGYMGMGQGPSSPKLLAPPTIIEPDNSDSGESGSNSKRSSQMVHHAGFINRMTDYSPAMLNNRAHNAYVASSGGAYGPPQVLAKGWKPFKLVLKGSKLYFYKPPGDRSAGIRELFPTELVAVLEDASAAAAAGEVDASLNVDLQDAEIDMGGRGGSGGFGGGKGKERDEGRRRRAYWGRGTHPALVYGKEIEKGTTEAVVHEAVFATTFVVNQTDAESSTTAPTTAKTTATEEGDPSPSRYKPEWREFAGAVVLLLPVLVGKAAFETEFERCASNLVNGAEDGVRAEEVKRVEWLARLYLDYHGTAANEATWEAWCKETIPDFSPSTESAHAKLSGVSAAAPAQTPPALGTEAASPNLGSFSPRPSDSKVQSILEALGDPGAATHRPQPLSFSPEALRNALEEEGLSRDLLCSLDPALLARSLLVCQKAFLQKVPEKITSEHILLQSAQNSSSDSHPSSTTPSAHVLLPFLGSNERPHWLTRLVLIQVLVPEPAGTSHMPSYDGRNPPAPRAHSRSEVISAWVRVAELARRNGDECSWRAIMVALCSRPIARLDKVWKRVDGEALSTVQGWVQILVRGDQPTPTAPLAIPWAGDAERDVRDALDKARCGEGEEWAVRRWPGARRGFDELRTTFVSCTARGEAAAMGASEHAPDTAAVDVLVRHWNTLASDAESRGLAAKFFRVDQFMSLSFAAEPRRRGLFEPYFWSRLTQQATAHPLAALLFPEPLPTVSFVNRAQIVRGRIESNTSLNFQDIRDLRLQADGDKPVRAEHPKLAGFDLGGTLIPVYNGELVLLVQPGGDAASSSRPASRAPSRPPSRSTADSPIVEKMFSRAPSIRVTPGSHGHGTERKSSLQRRNSLPSMSQRTSYVAPEVSSERPLRVVVQGGTLDRLVDVLAHGLQGVSVSVADDNGEIPLTDRKTREIKVDMDDFAQVWWNVFRSFVTPQVLFELLRKRYTGAHQPGRALTPDDVSHIVRLRLEVLETLGEWLTQGGGAQDALDDGTLFDAFQTFLTEPLEQKVLEAVSDPETEAGQALNALELSRKTLLMTFRSQTMRPIPRTSAVPPEAPGNDAVSIQQNYSTGLPDIDRIDPEELVNNLNAMASATFRNVTLEDLFVTADLLELQSADRTGWFLPRDPSTIADEVEIQSMSSYILEIEPSPLISEMTQDTLYRLLPPTVRSCIRAFGILRKWLVSKLVVLRIGTQARQQRMEAMLRAIEIARIRSSDGEHEDVPVCERPCVRSFAEAILTSAVLSVESRTYYRAWLGVAMARGTGCETLAAYLSKPVVHQLTSRGTLTADIGWLMEKVLEIISLPDVLESPSGDHIMLVNFEKRRSLQTLLANASGVTSKRSRRRDADRREFERLNNIEKELGMVHFDMRALREDAHREATQFGMPRGTKAQRPFQLLVAQQQEKNRRDRLWKDRLSKEKRQEQQRNDKREEQLNRAMNQRRQNPVMPKAHRNKKSMSSAFFQLMRPISSAFISETMAGGSPVKRTPAELDFVPSGKPSLVLSAVGAQVAHFINNERSFVFQIDTEDGGHYLLQAASQGEMRKWIETIERVSKMTAKRRLTYLGQNVKMQMSDELLAKPAVATRDPVAVFGVELEFLLQRESVDGDIPPGTIPLVLERLINEVERRGLTEVGIYRIAGAHSEVNSLRDALNRGEWPISDITDVHAVCDLIKSWFRVLPGGLFPSEPYSRILSAAGRDDIDLEAKVANVRDIVHTLPLANFDLLRRIIEHLEKVTDYEESNQMTVESLSTVFSPNLIRSDNSDIGTFFSNMAASHRVMKMLISHYHIIFDSEGEHELEADADAEHDEMEFDEPIPEEDEEEEEMFGDASDMLPAKLPSEPPVLSINLGSPASLSFHIP